MGLFNLVWGQELNAENTQKVKLIVNKIVSLLEPNKVFFEEIKNTLTVYAPPPSENRGLQFNNYGNATPTPDHLEDVRSKAKPKYYSLLFGFGSCNKAMKKNGYLLLLKKANNIKIILEKNKTLREKKILNLLIILRKIIAWEEHEDEHSVIFTGLAKSPETGLTIIEELDHLPEDYRQRTKELLENNVSLMDNFRVPLMKKMKKTLSELESVV